MALGSYPEVSIAAAQVARDEARALLSRGLDPVAERAPLDLQRTLESASAMFGVAGNVQRLRESLSKMPAPAGDDGFRIKITVPEHLRAICTSSKDGRTISFQFIERESK